MPTGCGGVLYPPGSLPAEAADVEAIRRHSATCDDTWLFFMWHMNGWSIRRAPGKPFEVVSWPSTQESLKEFHKNGMKDRHIADMAERFGTPRA